MYQNILVPTDGSDGAMAALEEVLDITEGTDATIHTLYVVDSTVAQPESGYVDVLDALKESGEAATRRVAERVEDAELTAERAVNVGTPHREILDYVEDHDIDLVVMGTHGRTGLDRYLIGSVTEKVVRTSPVPVLTVRAPERE
jgi:nucleotide-binding universal stress UspA family protein